MQRGDLVFDAACPGFFAEAGARGVALRAKADLRVNGRPHTRKVTFGRWPTLGLDEARPRAMAWLATVKSGVDPSAPQVPAGGGWTVAEAYAEHARGAVKRRGAQAQRGCDMMRERLARYCPDWLDRPLASITPLEARQRHDAIMAKVKAGARIEGADGARSANQVLRDLRAVWNRAAKVWRDLGPAPTDAVEWAPERNEHQIVEWSDLPEWKRKVDALPNPLRASMHTIGLFSGLRPGNLVSIRRDWLDLKGHVLRIPPEAMKGGRGFDLPLSDALVKLINEALKKSEAWFPDAPWLFPTRDRKGTIVATRVWKERSMPGWTGHALRHTYSAAVVLAGCSEVSRELLLAHRIPGIRGRYLDDGALWKQLLADQNRVSRKLLQLFTEHM
ncbi:MAG TPA: tyrosine-type recombinase/integrase [Polyangiaceae bacterium]|nr:tyrosine-type recombinase/integrase [Polyangiaceae bacterium]